MPKINKEDMKPEQTAEPEKNEEGNGKKEEPKTGRKSKTDQADTKPKAKACDHEFVFHAAAKYHDRPGKNYVWRRCARCNEMKLSVEEIGKSR